MTDMLTFGPLHVIAMHMGVLFERNPIPKSLIGGVLLFQPLQKLKHTGQKDACITSKAMYLNIYRIQQVYVRIN